MYNIIFDCIKTKVVFRKTNKCNTQYKAIFIYDLIDSIVLALLKTKVDFQKTNKCYAELYLSF